MNSDFKDLLRVFLENDVAFMVIGGYAVIHYTEPRYTKDLDILVSPTRHNATKVFSALKEFGAPLIDLKEVDLTIEGNFFQIGTAPNRINIIVSVPGVVFDEAFVRSTRVIIDGMSIPLISRDDLIQAKLAAGRPQDLVDASSLTKSKLNNSNSG